MSTTILPRLQRTTNYGRFDFHRHQQPISDKHVDALAESMRQFGFLNAKPVQCIANGDGLVIVDGHHRFLAAKSLGIPVVYVIEGANANKAIGPQNFLVKKWAMRSFVKMYANEGKQDYQTLLNYEARGIPLAMAAAMLHGHTASAGNVNPLVRHGTFKVRTTKHAEAVANLIGALESCCPAVRSRSFVDAVCRFLFVRGFDPAMLQHRIKMTPTMIQATARVDVMMDQLEAVYNYRAKDKVPLVHLARESAKARNAAGHKNTKKA